MIHLLLGASRENRDELHSLRDAVGTRELYADVLWVARDAKQGIAPTSTSGPCERTMGYLPQEAARVRVENLPKHLRSISS